MGNSRPVFILVIVALFVLTFSLHAQYSGGSGTVEDPYQIATAEDLIALGQNTGDYDNYFILLNDIDLSGKDFYSSVITPPSKPAFIGIFDGNGHTIHNLTIKGSGWDNIGLFGHIGINGQVNNLRLENANMSGKDHTGGLCGYNQGTITQCSVSAIIAGDDRLGGLCGINYGTITTCFTTSLITGDSILGGLVGRDYGVISSCYANCTVTGSGATFGGLVGQVEGGHISNCYATGTVSGMGSEIGGMIGRNDRGLIEDCYATSTITGNGYSSYIGGLIGRNVGSVDRCFWDKETSGQTASEGGKGLRTSQMKSIILYQNGGWADKGWVIQDGMDYPHRVWENTPGRPIPQPEPVPLPGSGTESVPYQIGTAADFALLSWHWSLLDKHFVLMNDLNLHGIELDPIGDLGAFTGVFEGQGHNLSNAKIHHAGCKYVGIWGRTGTSGIIRNIGALNVDMEGGYCVGGLAGDNDGMIMNCHATGIVLGRENVGGLIGDHDKGEISDCHAMVTVSGNYEIGGLVGQIDSGNINRCYATGNVSASENAGGLVAKMGNGSINDCYATGLVSSDESAGGLVAQVYNSMISNCYAIGNVSGNDEVGGLAGCNSGLIISCHAMGTVSDIGYYAGGLVGFNYGAITSCYATGSVNGIGNYIGGLVGSNSGSIAVCYSLSTINGIGNDIGGLVGGNSNVIIGSYAAGKVSGIGDYVGGFAGYNNNTITACFWDVETSTQHTSNGGIGKTTAEIQTLSTFTDAGWDLTGETVNGLNDYWLIEDNHYPRFTVPIWTMEGEGASSNPYKIANTSDLGKIWLKPTASYVLNCNLDLTGVFWSTAVIPVFAGNFDGRGFVISQLTINQPQCNNIGLFGHVQMGQIRNLGVENVNVTGDLYIGGLAGYIKNGTLTNSYATGSVNGNSQVGGLAGYNDFGIITACSAAGSATATDNYAGGLAGLNYGTITSCYADVSVKASSVTGGLCGENSGNINRCYARGSVTGNSYVGGLCGLNGWENQISYCYSTGMVMGKDSIGGLCGFNANNSAIIACFWDTETSTQPASKGGIGKTTAEMLALSTFIHAGWDFAGETANGTADIWHMPYQAAGYPMLWWQRDIPGDCAGGYGIDIEDFGNLSNNWLKSQGTNLSNLVELVEYWLEGL